jgi:signal peptidase I
VTLTDLALASGFASTVLAIFALHRGFFFLRVAGPSMEPALRAGDRLLVGRFGVDRPRRGRIYVVAEDDSTLTVKRAAAVPGDPVPASVAGLPGDPAVPAGCLVLLGDNGARSLDSRSLGYYRADRLRGTVVSGPRGKLLAWRR